MINYEAVLIFSAFGYLWSEVLTREDMIFGFVGGWLSKLPNSTHKPFYSCAICVTGFWSLVFCFIAGIELPIVYAMLSMLLTKILLRYA